MLNRSRWAVTASIVVVAFVMVSGTQILRSHPEAPAPVIETAIPRSASTHPIWNVVVIYLENFDIQDVNGLARTSYFKYLSNTYVNSTAFFAVCHPSAPNYLALLDGNPQQCNSETTHRGLYHNTTLPDLLDAKKFTWGGYFEAMAKSCQGTSSGGSEPLYLANFNPFIFFSDIYDNTSRCDSHVVNSSVFNASISEDHAFPANFSFYEPDSEDDCHYTSLPTCETWLKSFLTPILNTTNAKLKTAVEHTVFFITPDESDDVHLVGPGGQGDGIKGNTTSYDGAGYDGLYGGNTWLGAINTGGFLIHGHYRSDASIYNLLTTIEWLFGLGNTGGVDRSSSFPPLTGMFTFSSNGYGPS